MNCRRSGMPLVSSFVPTSAPALGPRVTVDAGRLFNAEDFSLAGLEAPAIWDRIITVAAREQASDIHLTYQKDGLHVRVRLDGRLCNQGVLPVELAQRLVNHIKVIARL